MSILLELLLEIGVQIIIELFLEFGFEAVQAVRDGAQEAKRQPPAGAGCLLPLLGLFAVGAVLGGLSLLVRPVRLFHPGPLAGWGILISPLCVGAAMDAWGRYRESRGQAATTLATFAGGATFAFGTALVRGLGVT